MAAKVQGPPVRTDYKASKENPTQSGLSRPWEAYFEALTNKINAPVSSVPPAAANSPGIPGQIAYDAANKLLWVCVANNSWLKVAIA